MTQDNEKFDETRGGQAGSQGQQGKGQSNARGFDQQSSSSMEKEQADQQRMSDLQKKKSRENED